MPVPVQTNVIHDGGNRNSFMGNVLGAIANPFLAGVGGAIGRTVGDWINPNPQDQLIRAQAKQQESATNAAALEEAQRLYEQEQAHLIDPGSTDAWMKKMGYEFDPVLLNANLGAQTDWGEVVPQARGVLDNVRAGAYGAPAQTPFHAEPPPTATPGPPNGSQDTAPQLADPGASTPFHAAEMTFSPPPQPTVVDMSYNPPADDGGAAPPPTPVDLSTGVQWEPVRPQVIDPTTPEGQATITSMATEGLARRKATEMDQRSIVGSPGFQPAKTHAEWQARVNPPILPEAAPIVQGLMAGTRMTDDQKAATMANNVMTAKYADIIRKLDKGEAVGADIKDYNAYAGLAREHWLASFDAAVLSDPAIQNSVLGQYLGDTMMDNFYAFKAVQAGDTDPENIKKAGAFQQSLKNMPAGYVIPVLEAAAKVTGLDPQAMVAIMNAKSNRFQVESQAKYQEEVIKDQKVNTQIRSAESIAQIGYLGAQTDFTYANADATRWDTESKKKMFDTMKATAEKQLESFATANKLALSQVAQTNIANAIAIENQSMEMNMKEVNAQLALAGQDTQFAGQLMGAYVGLEKEIASLDAQRAEMIMMAGGKAPAAGQNPAYDALTNRIGSLMANKGQTLDMVNTINARVMQRTGQNVIDQVQTAVLSATTEKERLAGSYAYSVLRGDYFKKGPKGEITVTSYKSPDGKLIRPDTAQKAQEFGRLWHTQLHYPEFMNMQQFEQMSVGSRVVTGADGNPVEVPITMGDIAGSQAALYTLYGYARNEFKYSQGTTPLPKETPTMDQTVEQWIDPYMPAPIKFNPGRAGDDPELVKEMEQKRYEENRPATGMGRGQTPPGFQRPRAVNEQAARKK